MTSGLDDARDARWAPLDLVMARAATGWADEALAPQLVSARIA